MKNNLLILLLLFVSMSGFTQVTLLDELQFEVNKVLPYVQVDVGQLKNAKTLIDLDKDYKESWIREYISVDILTIHGGERRKSSAKDDVLSKEQKSNMETADAGSEILIEVHYIPENNLSKNEIQLMDFKFITNPLQDAQYLGGAQKMMQYLKKNAIDEIPKGSFEGQDFAAVKFTIGAEGEVENVHLFDMSPYRPLKNEDINGLLLETIRKMPCWKPAEYANGLKVKQEYVFSVGNHESCVIPLLSIREF